MSYFIIAGIILILIGSYILHLGSQNDNEKNQKILLDKVNTFREELEIVRQDNVSDKEFKVDEISSEFDSWAIELNESYPEIKLSYNKIELEFSEKELKTNKEWRPLYLDFFSNLEKMVISLNKHLNNKIEIIKESTFPQSLFKNTEATLIWFLKFNGNNYWKIELDRGNLSDKNNLPNIEISFDDNLNKLKKQIIPSNRIEILIYENKIDFIIKGRFKYIDQTKLPNELSIESLNECLKTFMQYQLAQTKD